MHPSFSGLFVTWAYLPENVQTQLKRNSHLRYCEIDMIMVYLPENVQTQLRKNSYLRYCEIDRFMTVVSYSDENIHCSVSKRT